MYKFTNADVAKQVHFRYNGGDDPTACHNGILVGLMDRSDAIVICRVEAQEVRAVFHFPMKTEFVHLADRCLNVAVEDRYRVSPRNPMGAKVRRPAKPMPRPCTWPTM